MERRDSHGCVTVKIKQFFLDKLSYLPEIINMSNTYCIFPGYQIRPPIGFFHFN